MVTKVFSYLSPFDKKRTKQNKKTQPIKNCDFLNSACQFSPQKLYGVKSLQSLLNTESDHR